MKKSLLFLFLVLPGIFAGYSQQFKANDFVNANQAGHLRSLWSEVSFAWEKRQESMKRAGFENFGQTLLSDSLLTVRFMGFSKRGEPIYYQTYNLFAAQSLNTHHLWTGGASELNLNGEDITLHVWDGGPIRHTHQEFGERTTQMDTGGFMNGHATHVAGTMVAAGIIPTAKGMAPEALLHTYTFATDEEEMIAAAADGALLSNHSYGRPTGWVFHTNQWWWYGDTRIGETEDYKFGFYSEETQIRDEISYLAPYYLQVHAAGNDRVDTGPEEGEEHNVFDHEIGEWIKSTEWREPDGGDDGYDVISTLVLGKNVLTIGSVADASTYTGPESVELSSFSSTGPTDDGRIKPDLVAKGQGLLSTWVDNNESYAGLTGTSMAAPTMTGSLGLIQQLNKRLYGSYLRASTLKALVIHAAREAGEHPGPDYLHGWGLADMEATALLLPEKDNTVIIQERNLVQNTVPSYTRTVYSTGNEPLLATLVWTDVPAEVPEAALNDRTPMLVNDLDLRVTRLDDGQVFYPWKLDPDNPTAAATNGDNIVDNIEKIEIMLPDAGQYLVEVTHKGEIVDPTNDNNKRQSFSLVISGIAEREIDLALTNANVMVSGCGFNEQTPAFITVENKGQQTIENITVSYQLTDPLFNILHEGTMNLDMIQAGHSEDLLFDLDLSEGFEFILSASVNFPGDQLPANNTFTRNIISESFQVSDNAFQESFEGIVYLEEVGWQVLNENEDNASWMLRIADGPNQFASDGANSMRYGILNPEEDGTEVENQADDWLISTCLYLVPGENYRLSFDFRTWTGEYSENMKVMIGQVPEPGMLTTELVDLNAFTNSEFVTHMQQFTVETEGNYYIAFQVYSDPGHGFVYLDNIVVERMVFNDLAPVSINVAAQGCEFSEATPVEVSFANMGLDPQENFDIQLWVKHETSDTEYTINYTFEGALESEQTASHEFLADMAASGTYEVRLITALAGDENPQNDTLSIEVTNTGVNLANTNYFTDFNGVTQLEQMGWSVHSGTSGSTGWRMGQVPGHANSPPNSLNFYRSDESPVDEWAFTNCFVMEEGVYYRLRFMTATKGTNTEEYFWIYLLNEPSHEAEKELIGEVFVNHFDHQQRELIFQAPSTGYFHIGFFTDFVGPNTFQIYVDDFTVEKVLEKDAAALSIIQKEWGCNSFTDQTPVDIVIENKGLEQLAMASVVLTVEDEEQNQELYELDSELTLGLAEKDTLEFMVDLSAYNTLYTLTAEVVLADDDDPGNNTVVGVIRNTTVDLTVGQEYFTDFEQVTIDGHSDLVDPKTGWWYENTNNDFDIEGGPVTWVMRKNESFALSGEVSMRSGRNQEEAADDWLFTNCYIMNAGENYLFDFYYTGRTVSSTEKMSVYLGNAQQSEAMEQLLWDKTFNLGLDYQQAFVVVSPPEDGTYYIGFNHHSNPDEGWVYLDDVGMRKNFDLDVAVDSIVVEQQSCGFSENTPLNVTVKNTGNLAFDYPVTLTVTVTDPDGQMVFTAEETIEQAMEVNDVLDFNFFADMRKYGKYSIEAFVALPAEANESLTENNVISVEIRNTSMFPHVENLYVTFEDFENMQETGFTRSDLNHDGFTWDLGTTFTNYSFSGSSVFYYSFSASNAANDWLFSSCAHLQAGTVYNVSYYYRVYSGDYPEDMTFVLASEPHSDAIVQVLDVKEEMDNYNFRRVQYAFTVAEDGTYYFGWHASSPKYHRFMFMDDFALRVAPQVDGTVKDVEPVAETCDFTEEATFEATLVNLGSETLPEGSLSVTVSGPGPVQELLVNTPSVSALETAQVEFTASLTGNDRHTFQHQLSVPGDEVTGNNSGTMSLFPYALDLQLPGSWFIQDFETIFALREIGWTIHNTNNDNRYWGLRVNDPSLAHSGHNYLVYFTGNTTQAANDWVISGCYELSHERKYKAAFFYRLGSGDHNLRIAVGTAPQATAMEQVIWEQTQISAPSDQPYMHFGDVFEVDESGTYYFGVQQFSPAGQGSSLLDDVVIIAQPDILPIEDGAEPGTNITLQALASDSLRWYADEELTQVIGEGTSLTLTVPDEQTPVYAAEHVYGVTGPYDVAFIGPGSSNETGIMYGEVSVYPNPATGQVTLKLSSATKGKTGLKIVNMLGDVVYHEIVEDGMDQWQLDISPLARGTYMLIMTNREQHFKTSVVKF